MKAFANQISLVALVVMVLGVPVCPAQGLRPLSTDRPDTTESTHTVDVGHFQFEMEIATWTRDGSHCEFSFGQLNSKIGLDDSTDLQLVTPFFTRIHNGEEGFGDLQVRLKRNLWGNDEGPTSMAIMPFIQLPTSNGDLGSDRVEGGLIVPFAFDGPAGWSCAVMGELDLEANEDRDYHLVGLASATASHGVTEEAAVFLELVSVLSAESGSAREAYFNTGVTWLVTPAWQLDGGVRIGLTDASADYAPFLGMSTKF
jgi:Putative MetA-pathway of phenol degradation